MDPSFKSIADLFQPPSQDQVEIREAKRKKEGDTAEESDELGRQCLTDGDYDAAIKHFRRAVEQRDPNDIKSRIDLAGAYDCVDQYPQAFRQYERALRAQQDAAEPHVGISELYRRYGRFRDSILELQEAIDKEPANSFYHFKLAETLRDAGEPTRALQAVQRAVTSKPDESFYHYWMGDLLMGMRRYDEALDALRASIELSPGDDFLYLRAAVAFWCAGRHKEALKALRLASDLDPDKHFYHGLLEELLRATGMPDEADLERQRASSMDRYDRDKLQRLLREMQVV
jgi:tetratricopeptide (TPR) repeat protein